MLRNVNFLDSVWTKVREREPITVALKSYFLENRTLKTEAATHTVRDLITKLHIYSSDNTLPLLSCASQK